MRGWSASTRSSTSSPTFSRASTSVEDRIFTFKIRDGHKWSDGEPLTSEDFRYMWEDVLSNEDLSPGGFSPALMVDGKPPVFEVVDELTVRYSWDAPNPDFLPALAAAQPLSLVLPAALPEAVPQEVPGRGQARRAGQGEQGQELDGAAHAHVAPVSPGESRPADARSVAQHDQAAGRAVRLRAQSRSSTGSTRTACSCPISTSSCSTSARRRSFPAKTGAGESDLQATGIDFTDYTFLKDAEKRYPVKVSLWKRTQGSRVALLPNLNCRRRGLAAAAAGRARPPRAVAGDRPARDQHGRVLRARQGKRRHRAAGEPALQAGIRRRPGSPMIRTRPTRCSTRSA